MLNSWVLAASTENLGTTDCFSDSQTALARFDALTTLLPKSLVFLVLCLFIPLDVHCLLLGICSGVVQVPVLGRGTNSLGTLFLTIKNKAAASSNINNRLSKRKRWKFLPLKIRLLCCLETPDTNYPVK